MTIGTFENLTNNAMMAVHYREPGARKNPGPDSPYQTIIPYNNSDNFMITSIFVPDQIQRIGWRD